MGADLPVYDVKTMQDHLQHGYVFSTIILGGALSGLFGILGLALASIGLYGVVANTIGQRTREIGIRAALGAGNLSILALVLRQSLILVTAGALVGIVAGAAAAQLLKRVLFSVNLADPATFLAMVAILVMVATAACVIPARRAIKVDPVVALRHEDLIQGCRDSGFTRITAFPPSQPVPQPPPKELLRRRHTTAPPGRRRRAADRR